MRNINKVGWGIRLLSAFLCILLAAGFLAGCKVEWPEEVLGPGQSSIEPASSDRGQSSNPESSRMEDSSADASSSPESSKPVSSKSPQTPAPSSQSEGVSSSSPGGSGKDKYQTDPIPSGKPDPVEPGKQPVEPQKQYTVTFSIVCTTILDNMDQFNMDKIDVLPRDGVIYAPRKVVFYEGESVFDVLLRETKKNGIHMEFRPTPMYNSNYILGIHNLYEFDCGETSGWMYRVNGWFPNYGCSRYSLKDGDVVEWVYTCDLGKDVGGGWLEDGQQGGNP